MYESTLLEQILQGECMTYILLKVVQSEFMNCVIFDLLGQLAARKVFDQHLEKFTTEDGRICYKCNICGKQNSHLNNARNHIESVHFPGHFSYNCTCCEKTFKTNNALSTHVSYVHKC